MFTILNHLFPYGLHDHTDFMLIGIGITSLVAAALGSVLILITRK